MLGILSLIPILWERQWRDGGETEGRDKRAKNE
jgi:hypothetical protein